MTPIRTKEAVLSPELIHEHWPFLNENCLSQISGRVDRLYLALIDSGLSRSEAAHQIHQVIRASQRESQSTPWAQKTWAYRHGEATCTSN
jgi:hypothetical protein